MTTVTLQRIRPFQETQAKSFIGGFTGALYLIDQLGRATVDTRDAAFMIPEGWEYFVPGAGGGTTATSGVATIDFGAFPGSAFAQTLVVAADLSDPNSVVDAWIAPALTADHSIDEHIVDPPMITAYADGSGNVVITGVPRPGLTSPIPPDPMPYGKWNVAWAFAR